MSILAALTQEPTPAPMPWCLSTHVFAGVVVLLMRGLMGHSEHLCPGACSDLTLGIYRSCESRGRWGES